MPRLVATAWCGCKRDLSRCRVEGEEPIGIAGVDREHKVWVDARTDGELWRRHNHRARRRVLHNGGADGAATGIDENVAVHVDGELVHRRRSLDANIDRVDGGAGLGDGEYLERRRRVADLLVAVGTGVLVRRRDIGKRGADNVLHLDDDGRRERAALRAEVLDIARINGRDGVLPGRQHSRGGACDSVELRQEQVEHVVRLEHKHVRC